MSRVIYKRGGGAARLSIIIYPPSVGVLCPGVLRAGGEGSRRSDDGRSSRILFYESFEPFRLVPTFFFFLSPSKIKMFIGFIITVMLSPIDSE